MLLLFEVTYLLLDLGIIERSWFPNFMSTPPQNQVGVVSLTQQNVRRRSQQSILWETTSVSDKVYSHDSILTLEQSAAQIDLDGGTQLQLSENTLVVLEPDEGQQSDRLRIRFGRGDLQSRGNRRALSIRTDEWSVEAGEGSEFRLRASDGGKLQVELKKGQFQVLNKADQAVEGIKEGQILELPEKGDARVLPLSTKLKWEGPAFRRLYAHHFPARLGLGWQGQPSKIEHLFGENEIQIHEVVGHKAWDFQVTPGSHYFRLIDNDGVSETLHIQAWNAPVIHLLTPLSRDRIPLKTLTPFAWTPTPMAVRYEVEIGSEEDPVAVHTRKETRTPLTELVFEEDASLFWRVRAFDDLGTEIPPLYSLPFYATDNPFAAPKLKAPKTRRPASSSTGASRKTPDSWWRLALNWILPRAEAQTSSPTTEIYDVDFEWEEIDGADQYVIELDRKGDFRKPFLTKNVRKPGFTWEGAQLGTYYWRVAAGTSQGRMGVFSEPTKVALTFDPKNQKTDQMQGVVVRKRQGPGPNLAPAPPIDPAPQAPALPEVEITIPAQVQAYGRVLWGVVYDYQRHTDGNSTTGTFSGFSPLHLRGFYHHPFETKQTLDVAFELDQVTWKAAQKEFLPLQANQEALEFKVDVLTGRTSTLLSYGLQVQKRSKMLRTGTETVALSPQWSIGPAVLWRFPLLPDYDIRHIVGLGFGEGGFALNLRSQGLGYMPITERMTWLYGAEIGLDSLSRSGGGGFGFRLGIMTGLGF